MKKETQITKETQTTLPPDTSWIAKGRIFNSETPDGPCDHQPIPIKEQGVNVTMPTCTDPMGSPIDADLAIHFIQNYLNYVRLISNKNEYAHGEIETLDKKVLVNIVKELAALHEKVFKLNYGMTLDKNLAFKILSQPGCEGLRFYLCAKKIDKPSGHQISLVVAGVNCEGYDLNYPKNTSYTEEGVIIKSDGVSESQPTSSLVGEYVVPPVKGQGIDHFFNSVIPDSEITNEEKGFANRFALLNIARKGLKPF